jgi:PAS domain S-box-containing protein
VQAYLLLIASIIIQFIAAFLAFRLVWITKRKTAWVFIATAILLMAIRRCFTLYEWFAREMSLMAVDIGSELVGLATSVLMLLGVAFIAPLFIEIMRTKEGLRELVEEKTAELKKSYQALQLELDEKEWAEKSLKESEERFRTIADFTYDWECWVAPDGTYNYISPSCERITGYRADDFLKNSGLLEEIIHPEDRPQVIKHLSQDLISDTPHSLIFRIITQSGQNRWIAHVCQPVYSPEGKNLGRRVSNRDITLYKKAEAEKSDLEVQLRQAQKMEAIGTLAGGIAHDFNNILSPIIMYTEIAMGMLGDNEELRPILENVHKASKRAADLVKQILTISRQTERQQLLMQLGPIVKESLKLLRASLPATIEIRQEDFTERDWIMADPTEIYQIVMNLCTNAAHAMTANTGVLTVGLGNLALEQEQKVHGITMQPGNYLALTIRDTGSGISPEIMERIFEPYFTTKAVGQGTGLGLAVVHGLVKNYGGGINVLSEPGKGTTFQVLLPIVEAEAEVEPENLLPLPAGKERILLIDDESDIVAAAKIILEQVGYEVEGVTSSPEALEAFRAKPKKFDLIITDLTMPQLAGLDLAEEFLSVRPDIPIILCTGYSESITLEKARAMGIRQIILKPIMPAQLVEAIRLALEATKERG